MKCVFFLTTLLALADGCASSDYNARVFHPWGYNNALEMKARLDEYTNVLMVCIYEDHWEDRGPHSLSLHHYQGTVVHIYKGAWGISEKITFAQGLDYRVPTNPISCIGNLEFVFTNAHTNTEISLDTGELSAFNAEYAPALDRIYPEKQVMKRMVNKSSLN